MVQLRSIEEIEKGGTEAVESLRREKLAQGQTFMINSRQLPKGQCYLEYPDGTIRLAALSENKRDFIILKELTPAEMAIIRRKYHFLADA